MTNINPIEPMKANKVEPEVQTHTKEEREKFLRDINQKTEKIETKITSMKEEGQRLAGDMKRKADDNLANLSRHYQELKVKMEELKSATEENWRRDKSAVEKIYQDLSTSFKGLFS